MKLLSLFSILPALTIWSALPAAGHDCHHDSYYTDGLHCDHHGTYGNSRGMPSRGAETAGRPGNLRTLAGKIAEVVYLPGTTAENGMVEVRIEASGQLYLVRLAPAGFLKQSGLMLREGVAVTVKGFPVAAMEGDLLVATECNSGDKTVSLRDARGMPAW